jgi:hypothetical protein
MKLCCIDTAEHLYILYEKESLGYYFFLMRAGDNPCKMPSAVSRLPFASFRCSKLSHIVLLRLSSFNAPRLCCSS